MKNKTDKIKTTVLFILFMMILAVPVLLYAAGRITGIRVKNGLYGYTNSVEKVELSADSLLDTSFQGYLESVLSSKLPIYEAAVRTYNTIRYVGFREGYGIIGEDHSLFDLSYIGAQYSFGEFNYADPQKDAELQDMVNHLEAVDQKLRSKGKYLFVYVTPGKARLYPEDVPEKYTNMTEPGAVNITDLFREKIAKTEVPYLFCEDYWEKELYPAFYRSGIHWSRPYEQECSIRIIDCLGDITGKKYRQIDITGTEESTEPFWRDDDVFLLQNIWPDTEERYYQYNTTTQDDGEYDELNILLQGDSFGTGLLKDINENIPEAHIIRIDRDDSVFYSVYDGFSISDDWNNLELADYLDISDIVIVEMTDPEISNYTYGFIQYLDTFLDTYQQGEKTGKCFPLELRAGFEIDKVLFSKGVYLGSGEYVWAEKECSFCINAEEVSRNGLFVKFDVPAAVFLSDPEADVISVTVNGVEVSHEKFSTGGEYTIIIPAENLPKPKDGTFVIGINASRSFNPKQCGINDDDRNLALQLRYVGGTP